MSFRLELDPPRMARSTTRDLRYVADIYEDGSNSHRWRAYIVEGAAVIAESNGGEQSEGEAAQAAREWLINQASEVSK